MQKFTLRLFLLLVLSAIGNVASAAPVTAEKARQAALDFLSSKGISMKAPLRRAPRTAGSEAGSQQAEPYYVFNIGDGQGFVLVSGDDRISPILGYADKADFDAEQLPVNVKAWLDDYAAQINALQTGKTAAARRIAPPSVIAPLLSTTWDQGAPYNALCPVDPTNSKSSLTGCVATAMAQVVNYHRHPAATTATIPGYVSESRNIACSALQPTTIDWDAMLDDYSGSYSSRQAVAVATLMKLCGYSTKMDYTSDESGTQSEYVAVALRNYFDFDAYTRLEYRMAYTSEAWEQAIYEELKANRPVYYSGSSIGGGHAFVVDGVDKDGLFHVNWGWGGYFDGYFSLSLLNPESNSGAGASSSNDGYSFDHRAIFDAQPNQGHEAISLPFTLYYLGVNGQTTFNRTSINEDFKGLSFEFSLYNMTGETHTTDVLLAIFDKDENYVNSVPIFDVEFEFYQGYYHAQAYDIDLGSGLTDGTYYLMLANNTDGIDDYLTCVGSYQWKLKAVVSNNGSTLTLSSPVQNLKGSLAIVGTAVVNEMATLRATVENQGTDFNDIIFLEYNGKRVGGWHFDIAEGGNKEIDLPFTPGLAGNNMPVRLYYQTEEGEKIYFAEGAVNVSNGEGLEANLTHSLVVADITDGVLNSSKAEVTVDFGNTGTGTFKGAYQVTLLKLNGNYYEQVQYEAQYLTLKVGATAQKKVTFKNLDDNGVYIIGVYIGDFNADGSKLTWREDLYHRTDFTVKHSDEAPKLDATLAIKGLNAQNVLNNDQVEMVMTVNNVGTLAANGYGAGIMLFKHNGIDKYTSVDSKDYKVNLEAGASKSITVTFDGLEEARYAAQVLIGTPNGGEDLTWNPVESTVSYFTVNLSTVSIGGAMADQQEQTVYTLDGRRVNSAKPLRPGLYIINGRKVMR